MPSVAHMGYLLYPLVNPEGRTIVNVIKNIQTGGGCHPPARPPSPKKITFQITENLHCPLTTQGKKLS